MFCGVNWCVCFVPLETNNHLNHSKKLSLLSQLALPYKPNTKTSSPTKLNQYHTEQSHIGRILEVGDWKHSTGPGIQGSDISKGIPDREAVILLTHPMARIPGCNPSSRHIYSESFYYFTAMAIGTKQWKSPWPQSHKINMLLTIPYHFLVCQVYLFLLL